MMPLAIFEQLPEPKDSDIQLRQVLGVLSLLLDILGSGVKKNIEII